jgi:hypothetical protein
MPGIIIIKKAIIKNLKKILTQFPKLRLGFLYARGGNIIYLTRISPTLTLTNLS